MSTVRPVAARVKKLLRTGLQHHHAGRWGPAEACYLRSLQLLPQCAQALHLLGVLAQQDGNYQKSLQWMEESLALRPAEDDPVTLERLATTYLDHGQILAARRCYKRLAELLPNSASAHLGHGTALEWLGDWEAAAAAYQRALELQPDAAEIYGSMSRLQCKQGNFEAAVRSGRCALALAPHRQEIYNLLGYALVNTEDYSAAVEIYHRALALKPDSAYTVYGLGYFFERQGDLESAAESYRVVIKLDPKLVNAHLHLGISHLLKGEVSEAGECFERARELEPENAEVLTLLSYFHLLQGNFRLGWREHEHRWRTPHFHRDRRNLLSPLWTGQPLEGARILLHAEQGLGDTLQFVRYVPLVQARGSRVVLEVQPRVHRLLQPTLGAEKVIQRGDVLPEVDWQCPLMSLPLALATELSSIPASVPYVAPDPALVAAWGERLAGNVVRIGLAWSGSPTFPYERWRAIPLEALAPLTKVSGAIFYSLQLGPSANQVKQLGSRAQVIDLQDDQKDFADTAAIVANLHLVISVDTSVAHLAGAMGKPVWILLSKSADWRWLLDRPDSPWYPTARLFRQSTLGDWKDVLVGLERELRDFIARNSVEVRNRRPPP